MERRRGEWESVQGGVRVYLNGRWRDRGLQISPWVWRAELRLKIEHLQYSTIQSNSLHSKGLLQHRHIFTDKYYHLWPERHFNSSSLLLCLWVTYGLQIAILQFWHLLDMFVYVCLYNLGDVPCTHLNNILPLQGLKAESQTNDLLG